MNKLLYTLVTLFFSFHLTAQSSLSTSTKKVLYSLDGHAIHTKRIIPAPLKKSLPLITLKNQHYINALIQVDNTITIAALQKLGIIIHTKAQDIWTAQIPLESFALLPTIKGIKAVDIGGKMKPLLDEVRSETRANLVYKGEHLSQAYFGKDVVIGIIDQGFDYTHPTFYDSATKKLRISRIWNQLYNEEEMGLGFTPPAGYNYGMELVNPGDIIKTIDTAAYNDESNIFYLSDGSGETHGTLVAGAAAGSGWGTLGTYQGLAPKAEIVLVSINEPWSAANIIDGMQYIYNYAASVGKPAVINFSAGNHIGPHDGTSLLSQSFNNLTGRGKLIVGAAGNDGGSSIHLSHSFTKRDTVFTLAGGDFGNGEIFKTKEDIIDAWGSYRTDFSAKVMVYRGAVKVGETIFVAASSNNVLIDTIVNNRDTAFITIATEALNSNNKRPNIQVSFSTTGFSNDLSYHIAFTGANTKIHAWSNALGFINTGASRYIAGDDLYTVVDGQTAKDIIAVGAYAARNKYINIYGEEQNAEEEVQVGAIAPFSSKGPALDGRTKPDITAPGFQLISSASSFTDYYGEGGFSANTVAYTVPSPMNGRTYLFAAESGTSFASPVIAGTVALMLDANPQLTPLQAQAILKATARKDQFTGSIPFTGSNVWGWGKVNVHSAVKGAEVVEKAIVILEKFIYPNVVTDHITVVVPTSLKGQLCFYTILDPAGKPLISSMASSDMFTVPVTHLSRGSYFIQLSSKTATITNQFIKQ